MIILVQNLNQTKIFFEKSMKEFDRKMNSKIFSKHLKDLLISFDHLASNSIIVDQTKFLIIKTFQILFGKTYFLNAINLNLKNINQYFNEILQTDCLEKSPSAMFNILSRTCREFNKSK